MCGIAGVVWRDAGAEDRRLIVAMTERLAHRGPDDEAYWFAPQIALGFRRLSIIDPEHGRQPVKNEDGSVVAMCNGEIYNHGLHREELGQLGHRFDSGSDAEVLPHLYEARGEEFVSALQGKFALALYDTERRRLVLARDRLGIKPLYYVATPSAFWFASEIKSLLVAPDLVPEVDRRALDLLLAFKHVPGDETLLEGVRLLRPGTRLDYDLDSHAATLTQYYQIPTARVSATRSEAVAGVRDRFDSAVRRRLMSDVPIGVSLSGGLDSSAVCASVALQTGRGPKTFSVYAGDRVNELGYARMVAERYKTDHHEITVEPTELNDIVPTVMWHLEEPMSISEVPTYYLGRAVGGRVKVLLCGEGADELFGGYKRFAPISLMPFLPRRMLTWGYLRGINGLTSGERRALFSASQRPYAGGNSNPWLDRALAERGDGTVNRLLRYELAQQLRSQVTRLDKLTMAHGVEARCPFLDPELVDYVTGLPSSWKVRGSHEKVLLKRAMADRLPEPVIARRKFGMSNPVTTIFRGPFRDLCRAELEAGRDVLDRYFEWSAIDRLFGDTRRYPVWLKIPEQQLFHVYLFLSWHRLFVDREPPPAAPPSAMRVNRMPHEPMEDGP